MKFSSFPTPLPAFESLPKPSNGGWLLCSEEIAFASLIWLFFNSKVWTIKFAMQYTQLVVILASSVTVFTVGGEGIFMHISCPFRKLRSWHPVPSLHAKEMGKQWKQCQTFFLRGGSKITADGDCSHEIKTLAPWKESFEQPRQHIKKLRHYFVDKCPSSQSFDFFPLVMNRCESWSIKKAQNTINKVRRQLTKCKKIFTAFIQTKDNLPNT